MRPRVMLDIDGVVYKWSDTARYMLELYRGVTHLGESTHWDYIQENISKEDWRWLWSEGIKLGLYRHGHIYKGAVEGVQRLCAAADVVVITARPPSAVLDTLEWLSYNRFPIAEVHVIGAKTPKSTVQPACDIAIDDSPANAEDLHDNTDGTVLLWDRPWNQDFAEFDRPRIQRVYSWDGVLRWVELLTRRAA